MKLTSNKIFSFMLAAAFALTLAGCGGGGSALRDDDGDNGAVMECTAPQVGTYPDCMDSREHRRTRKNSDGANGRGYGGYRCADGGYTAAELDHADDTDTAAAIAAANTAAETAETAKAAADEATNPDAAEALADLAEGAKADADTALGNAMTASGLAEAAAVARRDGGDYEIGRYENDGHRCRGHGWQPRTTTAQAA